jgi:AraC family transcriptional regulator, regulatory protein of adaptative response / DNA-3-methyladenine glycosylase II
MISINTFSVAQATPDAEASPSAAADDARYLALLAHDARFDGSFFVAVSSTGIYCRPVCRVKAPKRQNCRFYQHAAQAEQAGYRPCLRCRPELAPHSLPWSIQDASAILAHQAARLLDAPESLDNYGADLKGSGVIERLAARLGISDRHVRRIFEAHFGVSPLQYLQTRRLLAAKQLLADTTLPITHVALASGYASVRRFNAAFVAHYRLNPTTLRRAGRALGAADPPAHTIVVKLGYRPPYDVPAMLAFFEKRAITGVDAVDMFSATYARTLSISTASNQLKKTVSGCISVTFDESRSQVLLRVSDSLCEALPQVISRRPIGD